MQQLPRVHADELLLRVPMHLDGRGVRLDDDAIATDDDEPVARRIEDVAVLRLALAGLFLGTHPLRDVAAIDDEAAYMGIVQPACAGCLQHPPFTAPMAVPKAGGDGG